MAFFSYTNLVNLFLIRVNNLQSILNYLIFGKNHFSLSYRNTLMCFADFNNLIMKKFTILAIGFFLLVLTSFTTKKTTSGFQEKLLKAKMNFEMPKDFKEVPIISNMQMNYDYAIKHVEKNFEVRFALHSLDDRLKDYYEKEKNKKTGEVNLSPNKLYQGSFVAIAFNIAGGKIPKGSSTFPPEAVKAEFNADWGAMTMVEAGKEFGQDYKYCVMVAIHKDDVADAYYFYLANDQQTIKEQMQAVFHSLKFN